MRSRLAVRLRPAWASAPALFVPVLPNRLRCVASLSPTASFNKTRPSLPFLSTPTGSSGTPAARSFTSERRRWLKHEAKLVVRYTAALWGILAALAVISFFLSEEANERDFPTPHEWRFLTRKILRDAHRHSDPADGKINWASALDLARAVLARLEDPACDGAHITRLSPAQRAPSAADESLTEFLPYDITEASEEWRRGYLDALTLAAKAAEHVDGWVRDRTRNLVSPPDFVIGPSNPRPTPIPPDSPHAPREEDCELAYPDADNWHMKILATAGLTPRQAVRAALEYASFAEFKGRREAADALYRLALAEAAKGIAPADLPYDAKTLVLKHDPTAAVSANMLDALTAMANFRARNGDVPGALPMYISLLKTRRRLSDKPPPPPLPRKRSSSGSAAISKPEPRPSTWQRLTSLRAPPAYPAAPSDGTQPPWRNAHERCHEASLHLYIGEILYATANGSLSGRADGLAWTRDGVDLAEEQLRALRFLSTTTTNSNSNSENDEQGEQAQRTCRQCLTTGLQNWSTMISRLARAEQQQAASKADASQSSSRPAALASLWSKGGGAYAAPVEVEGGRWAAEEAVVQERVRRTAELVEELPPPKMGFWSFFTA